MKPIAGLGAATLVCAVFAAGSTSAADGLFSTEPDVERSIVLPVAADAAWESLGLFCSLEDWQSLVASCVVEERADGFVRIVVMTDNTVFVERLEQFSNEDRVFAYSILSGPLPVENYRARFSVDEEDGGSRIAIEAWYDVPPEIDGEETAAALARLFDNGLAGMSDMVGPR
ncbi:MAG: SRPBCC family protein [Azospirillaceae bacterium]